MGLDGLVITEHHYQWRDEDLAVLVAEAGVGQFLLLSGFEYGSRRGDLLIFGLTFDQAANFPQGLEPDEAVYYASKLGGACVAAHPTRQGMGFDERLLRMPVQAVEVRSTNMQEHEQRMAMKLARDANIPQVASSDAHQLHSVGRYGTEFDDPIQSIQDLQRALKRGRFRPVDRTGIKAGGG